MLKSLRLQNMDKGLYTTLEAQSIPEQSASASLNWLTLGDKIELSGGYTVIGTENSGTGKITGLTVATKVDGTLLPLRTRGKKIEYYTTDWTEAGTDKLGTAADGEDVAITSYTSLAGYQAWFSSPNSGYFKMMLANPADVEDNFSSAKNFKGFIKAANQSIYCWYRANNKNYLYRSYKDLQNTTVYTTVTAEAIGASPGPTYTGTLATVSGVRTCFSTVFTDGTKTLTDDKNGAFTGDGTGTINYTTGAYSITFNGATVAPVTCTYQREDSTVQGVADFTFTSPVRSAAEGFFLPQPTGGDLLNVMPYDSSMYCLHQKNAWRMTISSDDVTVENIEWRENLGMENWRAAVSTGDGIFYIDTSDKEKPRFKLLTLQSSGISTQVVPQEFSYNIDLSGYDFSSGVGFQWQDYVLFTGKVNGASANNRVFAYNKIWKSFDVLDYNPTCFAEYDGALWAGDALSNNVMKLFSTTSANGSIIANYWEGKLTKLEVDELKKFKRLTLRGKIGTSQTIKVSLSFDGAPFVEVGRVVGTGSYVASSGDGAVGGSMVGSDEIGGGGSGASGYDYIREFHSELRDIMTRFSEVKIRIEAIDVGYASVSEINYYDIKTYGQKNLLAYRQT